MLNAIRKCKRDFYDAAEERRINEAETKPWMVMRSKRRSSLPWQCRANASSHLKSLLQFESKVNVHARMSFKGKVKNRHLLTRKIEKDELLRVIDSGKPHKAAGADRITHELMRESTTHLLDVWLDLFNYCLTKGQLPESWKTAPTVFISKGKGDVTLLDNYRNVVLQSVPFKVLTKTIQKRLESAFDKQLCPEQHGFRKEKGTGTAISAVIGEIEDVYGAGEKERKQKGGSLYVGFVDFQKAFDCLDRAIILAKVKTRYDLPPRLIRLLQAVLRPNELFAVDGEWRLDRVTQQRGVMQGDCLSPYLFVMFIDDLIETLKKKTAARVVMYADDLAIMTRNRGELHSCVLPSHAQQHLERK